MVAIEPTSMCMKVSHVSSMETEEWRDGKHDVWKNGVKGGNGRVVGLV